MHENNLEKGKTPESNEENNGLSPEQIRGKIAVLEAELANIETSTKEVGGDQGIKETVAKMSSEEKEEIVNKLKKVIGNHKEGAKEGAKIFTLMAIVLIFEYIGISDLENNSWNNFGHGLPDWYDTSGKVLMGVTALPGAFAFAFAVTKGIQTLKERVKLWNFNRKNKE